jgi:hypothetical protein
MGFSLASLNVFPKVNFAPLFPKVDFQKWILQSLCFLLHFSQKWIGFCSTFPKSGFYSRYAFGSTFSKGGFSIPAYVS